MEYSFASEMIRHMKPSVLDLILHMLNKYVIDFHMEWNLSLVCCKDMRKFTHHAELGATSTNLNEILYCTDKKKKEVLFQYIKNQCIK